MIDARDAARCFIPYPDVPVPHAADGPLAGLGFAVKDLYDVAGYPTGGGNPHVLAMSGIKSRHAHAVQLLVDAGARFVGKVITDELAFSMNGKNAHFGSPVNGAAPDRITGGSSSGSASAVSNGLADLALGSDTGGSVRCPASHCGLFGIRPTQDRISLAGCLPLAPSFDTCGYFARDGATFLRAAPVLLGADPRPLPVRPSWRMATDLFGLLEPDVAQAHAPALAAVASRLGPRTDASVTAELGVDFDALYWSHRFGQGREAWLADGPMIERYGLQLGPGVRERFEWASRISDAELSVHLRFRQTFREAFQQWLGDGVLVLPTMPDVAPLSAASEEALEDYRNRAIRLLSIGSLTGCPQVSVPLLHRHGAPMGLSLMGPPGSDVSLIALAAGLVADGGAAH